MPDPEVDGSVRSYQFVSDPEYKENLSGRVRAACITCRRKKIRCSGEVPCQTCKERGVVCEGLTQRKRPHKGTIKDSRKARDASAHSRQDSSKAWSTGNGRKSSGDTMSDEGTGNEDPSRHSSRRPSVNLEKLHALAGDSGYASGKQSSPGNSSPALAATHMRTFSQSGPTSFNEPHAPNHVRMRTLDWAGPARSRLQSYIGELSPVTQPLASISLNGSTDWSEARDRMDWWSSDSNNEDNSNKLLSAARMLEAQAQSLRQLASEQNGDAEGDTRRRTVVLPLTSEDRNVAQDTFQYYSQSAFDDLALLSDRPHGAGTGLTPRTGLTPGTGLTPYATDNNTSYFDIPFEYGKHLSPTQVPVSMPSDPTRDTHASKASDAWPNYATSRSSVQQGLDTSASGTAGLAKSWTFPPPTGSDAPRRSFDQHAPWPR
ncbi:hypothetical protein BDY17DRAFT_295097 [Neohortaea acidophila]|uniref:Zn(2)-C6 fungal-type domain-containing protein n=1 Tax=Neohortaea acidophila TaxID=245834 RepID=A0A6A6PWK2_9PEZI|nr:uncharacterized protein BDY17DRAFT_295097 [Neohortaea acidophila]KAF2484146.1 hypothetical protein BDY17DRAFT_295097 [Neohortaea acidophila]